MIKHIVKRKGFFNSETLAILLAYRHPDTPVYPKLIALATLVYMFLPIDIVPDVIPVIGWVDDFAIAYYLTNYAGKLIPADVMAECRAEAVVKYKKITQIVWAIVIAFILFSIAMIFVLWKLVEYIIGLF